MRKHALMIAAVALAIGLHAPITAATAVRRTFVATYRPGLMTQVVQTRVARGELTWTEITRADLFVSSPFGTVGTRWRVCAAGQCWRALQVDVPQPAHQAGQIKRNVGLEVSAAWYPVLGCVVGELPQTCRATMERVP